MTATGPEVDDLVRPHAFDVDGVPMSALVAAVPRPRAVLVALHGGATTSVYFDCPGRPRASLLRTAAALGYTTVALDRPGYGRSAPHAATLAAPARRVDLAFAAVETLLAGRDRGAGTFLLAHSIGCELALRMAADARGAGLLGLEFAGTGLRHQPGATAILAGRRDGPPTTRPAGLRPLLWQPTRLYPADVVGGATIGGPSPAFEGEVVRTWASADLPALAARVRIPVRYSLGDHEQVWLNGPAALAEVAALFTAAPRVEAAEQVDGGHNLSLGLTAMAYHLKVLAFLEECVAARAAHVDR
jgi:pimeloyl-ACP methyl ester carboxylesterase